MLETPTVFPQCFIIETPTIVFMLRGRGPLISRVFTFFVIVLLFCIRASPRQNETTPPFRIPYGNIARRALKID